MNRVLIVDESRTALKTMIGRLTPKDINMTGEASAGVAAPRRGIVVIGASTGGPVAISQILRGLSQDFPIPIVAALHCTRRLSSSISDWLGRECSLNVSDARDGEPLLRGPGRVLTAPPGRNLEIRWGRTVCDDVPGDGVCTPNIDRLFKSAAESYGDATIGVLLSGMGTDGARGLQRIRECGGRTIVQDEESCVVFGMPAAAIELGAAQHVSPLSDIPQLLVRLTESSRGVGKSNWGSTR